MSIPVKHGLYMGLASILYTFGTYILFPENLFNMKIGFIIGTLIYIVFMTMSCIAERKANEGFLEFGEAFKSAFVSYAIGAFIATMAMFVLFNFVDPSLIDQMKDYQVEMMNSMGEKFGMNEEQIAEMEAEVDRTENPLNFSGSMMGYLFNLIIGGIISAIIGAITKRSAQA